MHQLVSANVDSSRRWAVLAIVVAAQFMFGVDAFIVNVAIPTIAIELHASAAQIEAVIAIYLIAYATLVVTGGRLGDSRQWEKDSAREGDLIHLRRCLCELLRICLSRPEAV